MMLKPKPVLPIFSLLVVLALLLSSILIVAPVSAEILLYVTSTADSGAGSLRQAIADISPEGTIKFHPSLSGQTIVLESTLVIGKMMTIDGSDLAVPIAISGNEAVRVFSITSSGDAEFRHLKIKDGLADYGGGIRNDGYLTLRNCTLTGNTAQDAGGAILNFAHSSLLVYDSTISNNSAARFGGGIHSFSYTLITKSTLYNNRAGQNGGGINTNATMVIINSTISNNIAVDYGGGIFNNNYLSMTNSTLYANEADSWGGILNNSTFSFHNTIIANSIGGDCSSGSGNNNLVTDGRCGALLSEDPNLNPLADNGGPTQTHMLNPGSPAIDAGSNTICLQIDQRGYPRPVDGNGDGVAVCDIGAVEYFPPTHIFLPLILR